MKNFWLLGFAVCIALLVVACSQTAKERSTQAEKLEMPINKSEQSSTSKETQAALTIPTRQFIRTADIKFRVKSVEATTYTIEDLTMGVGGFVILSSINNKIDSKSITAISADSSLENTHFSVTNEMIIRVPDTRLDTTLKIIATLIDFLDYRVVKANDVSLEVLRNNLAQKRAHKLEKRMIDAIDSKGEKLADITSAEVALIDKQTQADESFLANMALQDKVSYSTINLSLYQRQSVQQSVVPNSKSIDAYKPSMLQRIAEAAKSGWLLIEDLILCFVHYWALLLLAIVGWFGYKLVKSPKV